MGDVFRQQYRREDGSKGESSKWYGQYRDHAGRLRRVPLATDKAAARAMLAELVRQAERRRAGLADDFTEAAGSPLAEQVRLYLDALKVRGRGERHIGDTRRLLGVVLGACGWETPGQMDPAALDTYLAGLSGSARTRATHRQAVMGLANWLVKKGKLMTNPLARSTRPEGEETRKRRALSADELRRLVEAARERPLREALLIRWGPRTGLLGRQIKAEDRAALGRQGRHNALLYRMAFYTGLRAGELVALLVGDLVLDGPHPRLLLPRERTKGKRDALIPLRPELAADLRAWIDGEGLGPADPVFAVPRQSAAMLRKDLKAAGIPYRDARGRVADFHALRASLATHLNASGVVPTTAKNLMRHRSITLTMDTYHDPAMDDARAALGRLPEV